VPLVIAGNKNDLVDEEAAKKELESRGRKMVEWGDGLLLAAEVGAVRYRMFSALTQKGLKELFDLVIEVGLCKPSEQGQDKKNCSLQ
jgi:predicted GTPase